MIRDSPAFTAQPVGFEPVRIPQSAIRNGAVNGLALWRPVPPRGFVALGLVATVINNNSQTEVNSQTEEHTPAKRRLRSVRSIGTRVRRGGSSRTRVRWYRRCAGVDSGQLRQDRGGVGAFFSFSVWAI